MVTRASAFHSELDLADGDAEELLARLRSSSERPAFRPQVIDDAIANEHPNLVALMQRCWTESVESRPSAAEAKAKLRAMLVQGGFAESVMDNLLQRMEQYSEGLEALVDARTAAFFEEKERSETLLYSILPREVANQLKRGEDVVPESFERVTIYFRLGTVK